MAEKDFSQYASKEPTPLHVSYKTWLAEKIGIGADALDLKTIQLAVVLYGDYQASPERKADKAREDAQAAERKAAQAAKSGKATTTRQQRLHAKALEAAKTLQAAGIELPAEIQAGIDALTPKVEPAPAPVKVEEIPADPEPIIGFNDVIVDDKALIAELEANPAPAPVEPARRARKSPKPKVDAGV